VLIKLFEKLPNDGYTVNYTPNCSTFILAKFKG